ncbi:R.Pab1 family restriction endonuclease [Helicobacter pylori]|uniref:R.Pab1 family restriction endonuclease n=1 Tax=Helicobacter pylori TaxID=210 RepID=UPI001F1FB55A|nr:R.Pab1 family restriction endonuclease [Helicobacter pylori]
MSLIKINHDKKVIEISIPLTMDPKSNHNHIRIKSDYLTIKKNGEKFLPNHYVEWQIGYYVPIKDKKDKKKFELTTLKDKKYHFSGANNEVRTLYELSEIIYYAKQLNWIKHEELQFARDFLQEYKAPFLEEQYFPQQLPLRVIKILHSDSMARYCISHSNEVRPNARYTDFCHKIQYNHLDRHRIFLDACPTLEFPLSSNYYIEVTMKRQQRGSNIQPMLYFCFSILELKTATPLLNRTATLKEHALFIIHEANAPMFLEMLKIFGLLSQVHHDDVLKILEKILQN